MRAPEGGATTNGGLIERMFPYYPRPDRATIRRRWLLMPAGNYRSTRQQPTTPAQLGTRASTLAGLPEPRTIFSGATTSSAPVGGSSARFASWVRPYLPAPSRWLWQGNGGAKARGAPAAGAARSPPPPPNRPPGAPP